MLGFLPSMGAGKASFHLFSLQDHKAISEVFSAGKKIPSKHDKQPAKQLCLGFLGRFHAKGRRQRESCSGHTPALPFSTPQMLPGLFSHITWHRWRLELANIFLTALWEDTQLEKIPKQAPGMAEGGGREIKPPALVSDLNMPKLMARQGHCLPCTAEKTMLVSSNPSAAFHSICSWKLLWFSLSLQVPSPCPSPGWISLPRLPWLMSESFHLTKSLLCRVSPVSLHSVKALSTCLSILMTYGAGTGGGRPWEGDGNPTPSTAGQEHGEPWECRRHLGRITLERVAPAQGSALLSPLPQRKRHFWRALLSRMADPALHLYSGALHCGHQSLWGHQPHTKAQPDSSLAQEMFYSPLDLTHTPRLG